MITTAKIDASLSAYTALDREATWPGAWWMLVVLLSLKTLAFVDRYINAMLVPPIKTDLKLTDFAMGIGQGSGAFPVSFRNNKSSFYNRLTG